MDKRTLIGEILVVVKFFAIIMALFFSLIYGNFNFLFITAGIIFIIVIILRVYDIEKRKKNN